MADRDKTSPSTSLLELNPGLFGNGKRSDTLPAFESQIRPALPVDFVVAGVRGENERSVRIPLNSENPGAHD